MFLEFLNFFIYAINFLLIAITTMNLVKIVLDILKKFAMFFF